MSSIRSASVLRDGSDRLPGLVRNATHLPPAHAPRRPPAVLVSFSQRYIQTKQVNEHSRRRKTRRCGHRRKRTTKTSTPDPCCEQRGRRNKSRGSAIGVADHYQEDYGSSKIRHISGGLYRRLCGSKLGEDAPWICEKTAVGAIHGAGFPRRRNLVRSE